jgi:LacI family repressor for deo operon, udp, cdd, tsx, nupC, and nupG
MSDHSPTLKEIARQLNVSVSTVSRALHNHYSIGLRTKMQVQKLASELHYEPNQAAILFKQKRTFMIGVILPNLSQDFFASMVEGIEDVAYEKNYTVLLCQSRDDQTREKQLVNAMRSQRVDGVLISISKDTTNYEHFELLRRHKIPMVFLDRIPKMPDIHYIASSLGAGMQQAIDFLIKKKHKCIALINGPGHLSASQERLESFRQTLWQKRRKYDPSLVICSDLSKDSTCKAMQQLLDRKQRPDAVITFNDYIALDCLQYAKRSKIKGISFVSFANEPICSYIDNAPIASVEQFPYQQGEKATQLLLQLLDKQAGQPDDPSPVLHHELLQPQLVIHRPG